MAREWQAWRLMDEIRYALEAKGWRPAFPERPDNEVAPLAAESGGTFVALVKLEPGTGE